ncbi:glucose dehydrogenase [Enterovibrio norvegicus FF-162]|uniref:PQQ-dependent sugar dehydrogenase n=1 Tax=Enterovibrio norvegicus TaxID=188144 RepID=UPI0002DE3E77|nr:PQQ-dependent sugar dehydrogenase [Enterovibrio norvegicus]OEE76441.1 glucose dehydrogenase [Enterovibrio norvegicus FF-162]
MHFLIRLARLRHIAPFAILFILSLQAFADTVKSEKHTFSVDTLVKDLNHPWSLVFLPDGSMVVSERNGVLKHVSTTHEVTPIQGLPDKLVDKGQGGLLGLALATDFEESKTVYIAFTESGHLGKSGTSVVRAQLNTPSPSSLAPSNLVLSNITPLFTQTPKLGGGRHFGGRLLVTDEYLYIALGDRGNQDKAQQNRSHVGTLIRLNHDGSVPIDNPFTSDPTAKPEIFSFGHRNIQGMTIDNDGKTIWTHEHGPQGGDELNPIAKGANYGWPIITYGVNYGTGSAIGKGTEADGMEQPLHYWAPSIAPSGLEMVSGSAFPRWEGDLLLGSLKFGLLVRLDIENGKVVSEERLLDGKFGRIRDVVEGPDGFIYLLTDSSNGALLRLRPQ